MEFPITVTGIDFEESSGPFAENPLGGQAGDWVCVRPCGAEYKDKTYLGVLLGAVPLGTSVTFNKETGQLRLRDGHRNPAIYIPDLKKVVLGCESWWGVIESPEGLKQITDADISNVWYVRALKELLDKAEKENTNEAKKVAGEVRPG
jgi:hypothetical protein